MGNGNAILDKSFQFSLSIIEYCELLEEQKKFVIAHQLLKSGTSIGANVHEAQSSESKLDFIHKLKVADKEAIETEYWLKLCNSAENYPKDKKLFVQLVEIRKLLNSIISKAKQKLEEEQQKNKAKIIKA